MKRAKNYAEAWKIIETYKGQPYGWVQWKGTDVCMDLNCKCGVLSHFDGDFCYEIKCPVCGTAYMCNGHIELIEIDEYNEENIKIARE